MDASQDQNEPEIVLGDDDAGLPEPGPDEVVLAEAEDDEEVAKLPKRAKRLPDGRVELPLMYPVTVKIRIGKGPLEEQTFSSLKMRRLNGTDRKVISAQPKDQVMTTAIARSAGMRLDLMNQIFERMDGADTTAAEQVVAHFLGFGQ